MSLKHIHAATPATERNLPSYVNVSPDGEVFVYCCGQNVFLRNVEEPLNVDIYTEHNAVVTCAAFSPSGFYVASADVRGQVRVWDAKGEEHKLKAELQILGSRINELRWSPDSQRIIAAGEGQPMAKCFMFDSGNTVGEITGHTKKIQSCDFKQTRPFRIATASEDQTVCFFEGPPFKWKATCSDHSNFVNCARFSPDGTRLVTVSSDRKGMVFDGATFEKVGELDSEDAHGGSIIQCAWSSDSKTLLTASSDKTCKLWDMETLKVSRTFNMSETPGLDDSQVAVLFAGQKKVSLSLSGYLNFLDDDSPNVPPRVLTGHNKAIQCMAANTRDGTLYTSDFSGRILGWQCGVGDAGGFTGTPHSAGVTALAVNEDSILVSGANDDTLRFSSLETREHNVMEAIKTPGAVLGIACSGSDASCLVAVTASSLLLVKNGAIDLEVPTPYGALSIDLSPDESTVAVGGGDNQIHLYSLSGSAFSETKTLAKHNNKVNVVKFSKDGAQLASGDFTKQIHIWDTSSWEVTQSSGHHQAKITSISWSPSGTRIASGSLDGFCMIHDLEKKMRIKFEAAHRGGVNAVTYVDENTVCSAGADSCVKVWGDFDKTFNV